MAKRKPKISDYFIDDEKPTVAQPTVDQTPVSLEKPTNETVEASPTQPAEVITPMQPKAPAVQAPVIAPEKTTAPETETQPLTEPIDAEPIDTNLQPIVEKGVTYKSYQDFYDQVKSGFNPMAALIEESKPVMDEAKQERLRKIMAVNSVGKAIGTVFQGMYANKGATITKDDSEFLPKTYAEYLNNIKDYDTKKLYFDKNRADLQGRMASTAMELYQRQGQQQFASGEADKDRAFREEQAKLERDARAALAEENRKHDDAMLKARGEQEKQQEIQRHKNRLGEIGYQGQVTKDVNASKPQTSGSGSSVIPPDKPFTYRNTSGKQVTLQPGQHDYINMVLAKAYGADQQRSTIGSPNYDPLHTGDPLLKKWADGKLSEDDARTIMTKYGDEYLAFPNGVPMDKQAYNNWNQASRQVAQSNADYATKYNTYRDMLTKYDVPGYGRPLDPNTEMNLIMQFIVSAIGEK